MLDGAAVVDYTHSGVTTRDSSSNVTPSSSTGNMASVRNSDVPADIAHLDPKYIKKLKMMSFISETPGNKLSRQAVIDKYTKEQESEKVATLTTSAGGGDRSALFSQLNGGAFSLKKAGSSAKDKSGAFNPKDARKVRLNKSSAIPVTRDESSITNEIEKLESEIVELQSQLIELEALKTKSGSTEKIERQIIGKVNLITGKQKAIRDKIKERGLLIGKKKNESGTNSASEGVTDASLTSMSPPISVSAGPAVSPSLIPLEEPVVLVVPPSPIIAAGSVVSPSTIVLKPIITKKVDPAIPLPPEPILPKKPLKIVATGSIFADLSMSHTGSLRKASNTSSKAASTKTRNLKELELDKTNTTEKIEAIAHQKEVLELEIQGLEVKRDAELVDTEKEKIEKLIITKNKLLNSKKILIQSKEEELRKIEVEIPKVQLLARGSAWGTSTNDDDSDTDSDDDPDKWD